MHVVDSDATGRRIMSPQTSCGYLEVSDISYAAVFCASQANTGTEGVLLRWFPAVAALQEPNNSKLGCELLFGFLVSP